MLKGFSHRSFVALAGVLVVARRSVAHQVGGTTKSVSSSVIGIPARGSAHGDRNVAPGGSKGKVVVSPKPPAQSSVGSSPQDTHSNSPRNRGFRRILGGLIRNAESGSLNTAVSLVGHWLEDCPTELKSLNRTEFDRLKKLISKCSHAPMQLTVHSLMVLANVCAKSNNPAWAIQFLDLLIERGYTPSPDMIPFLFTRKNVQATLDWVENKKLSFNASLTFRVMAAQGAWAGALTLARHLERRSTIHPGKGSDSGGEAPRASVSERYTCAVLLSHLIRSGGGNDDGWRQALALVRHCLEEGTLVVNGFVKEIIEASVSKQHWQASLYLLDLFHRCDPSNGELTEPKLYNAVLDNLPSWDAAIRVHQVARSHFVTPDEHFISAVLSHCERANQWMLAAKIGEQAVRDGTLSSFGPSAFEVLIRTYNRNQQWLRAMEAVHWMSEFGQATNAVGYIAIVDICERCGDWEPALRLASSLLQTTRKEDISPETYTSIIRACSLGGQWAAAMETLSTVLALPSMDIPASAGRITLHALIHAGKWQKAVQLFSDLRGMQPRVVTTPTEYLLGVKALVRGGQWQAANRLLGEMEQSGVRQQSALKVYIERQILASVSSPAPNVELSQSTVPNGNGSGIGDGRDPRLGYAQSQGRRVFHSTPKIPRAIPSN
jgi:hypothetical protein